MEGQPREQQQQQQQQQQQLTAPASAPRRPSRRSPPPRVVAVCRLGNCAASCSRLGDASSRSTHRRRRQAWNGFIPSSPTWPATQVSRRHHQHTSTRLASAPASTSVPRRTHRPVCPPRGRLLCRLPAVLRAQRRSAHRSVAHTPALQLRDNVCSHQGGSRQHPWGTPGRATTPTAQRSATTPAAANADHSDHRHHDRRHARRSADGVRTTFSTFSVKHLKKWYLGYNRDSESILMQN